MADSYQQHVDSHEPLHPPAKDFHPPLYPLARGKENLCCQMKELMKNYEMDGTGRGTIFEAENTLLS